MSRLTAEQAAAHARHKKFLETIRARAAALAQDREKDRGMDKASAPARSEVRAELDAEARTARSPALRAIQKAVCEHFHIRLADMLSGRRVATLVWPRHVAIYLATELTAHSMPRIGRDFNRDHTTVLYVRDIMPSRLRADADRAHEVALLLRGLMGDAP